MIVQVYLTIAFLVLLIGGLAAWALLPPIMRRLKLENEMDAQRKLQVEKEAEEHAKAAAEVAQWYGDAPRDDTRVQENKTRET
jgi:flagellar biosynthesis/type III secretory pathway M-ring protein FliF/YscJ